MSQLLGKSLFRVRTVNIEAGTSKSLRLVTWAYNKTKHMFLGGGFL